MPKLDLSEEHLKVVIELLQGNVPGAEVWAYGSRVRGTARSASDLDLVVRPQAGRPVESGSVARLRGAFEESDLPILVDVFDWSRLPQEFREEIERNHVTIPS